jgi:hypothetical protein
MYTYVTTLRKPEDDAYLLSPMRTDRMHMRWMRRLPTGRAHSQHKADDCFRPDSVLHLHVRKNVTMHSQQFNVVTKKNLESLVSARKLSCPHGIQVGQYCY